MVTYGGMSLKPVTVGTVSVGLQTGVSVIGCWY